MTTPAYGEDPSLPLKLFSMGRVGLVGCANSPVAAAIVRAMARNVVGSPALRQLVLCTLNLLRSNSWGIYPSPCNAQSANKLFSEITIFLFDRPGPRSALHSNS